MATGYKKGDWLTNHPRSIKGWWPRRDVKIYQGRPKATDTFTVEQLEGMGQVGAYLAEDVPEGTNNKSLIKNPR